MYWFDVLEILKNSDEWLDIYDIAERMGYRVNYRRLRTILKKLYLKEPRVERRIVRDGYIHKYIYRYDRDTEFV